MSDEPPNVATALAAPPPPASDAAPVIGYRNIVDDRRPTPWLDLLGLVVSAAAILFFLLAIVVLAQPTLAILVGDPLRDPLTVLFFFALSVTCLYLSCMSALTYANWVHYGRPRNSNAP